MSQIDPCFEIVEKFTCQLTTLTNQNCIHEVIKSRINMANACYVSAHKTPVYLKLKYWSI